MHKIIGVIPARFESSRFPGKPLALIAGKPMVQWVYRRAEAARNLQKIVIATDSTKIQTQAKKFTPNVVMTSKAHPSGTDRVLEVVEKMECLGAINIQGDEPLIDPDDLDRIATALDQGTPMVTLIARINTLEEYLNPNVVKVIINREGFACYFSRAPIPSFFERLKKGSCVTQEDIESCKDLYKHIGIYGYRKDVLRVLVEHKPSFLERMESLEQLRALENGILIRCLLTDNVYIGVDTAEDIPKVEQVIRNKGLSIS